MTNTEARTVLGIGENQNERNIFSAFNKLYFQLFPFKEERKILINAKNRLLANIMEKQLKPRGLTISSTTLTTRYISL